MTGWSAFTYTNDTQTKALLLYPNFEMRGAGDMDLIDILTTTIIVGYFVLLSCIIR